MSIINEHWEFDAEGLMRRRDMSANDYPIQESERRYRWGPKVFRKKLGRSAVPTRKQDGCDFSL